MDQESTGVRSGLRIRGSRGHPEVRGAYIRYAVWLRQVFEFPIRVSVYLSPRKRLAISDKRSASAAFQTFWERDEEPFIQVATGDYPNFRRRLGRDDALATFLCSLSHEILHYRQWVETGDMWEEGVVERASELVDEYAETVDRP